MLGTSLRRDYERKICSCCFVLFVSGLMAVPVYSTHHMKLVQGLFDFFFLINKKEKMY